MRFKNFLLLENTEDQISDAMIKKVVKFANPAYLDVFLNEEGLTEDSNFIFRGTGHHSGLMKIKDHVTGRQSANTSNEFTILVDNFLPSWKKYPRRSESFICTTSFEDADAYGDRHYVIPFGNPDVGICPSGDMWTSFNKLDEIDSEAGIPDFNGAIHEIYCALYNVEKDNIPTGELPVMKKLIKDVNEILDDKKKVTKILKKMEDATQKMGNANISSWIIRESVKTKDMLLALDKLLNTKTNEFELLKPIQLLNAPTMHREVWFSSQAAFIFADDEEEVNELRDRISHMKLTGK